MRGLCKQPPLLYGMRCYYVAPFTRQVMHMSKTATILIPPVFPTISQPAHAHMNAGFVDTVHHAIQYPNAVEMREVNRLIGGRTVPAVQVATKFGEAVAFVGRMRADIRGSRGTGNHFHVFWVDGKSWAQSEPTSLRAFITSASMMIQDVPIRTLARMLPPLYKRIMNDPAMVIRLPFNVGSRPLRAVHTSSNGHWWSNTVKRPSEPRRRLCGQFGKKPEKDIFGFLSWIELIKRGRFGEAVVELPRGTSFQGRLTEIGDAHISFQAPDYTRRGVDELFMVRTPEYFRRLVDWNRAFMLCQGIVNVKPFVLLTHVEQPRNFRSSHITIRQGLRQLLGEELDLHEVARLELSRGYIRPGQEDRFEVYSLSGAKMFEVDGSLSEQSISVQDAFRTMLNIDVDVVRDDNVSLRSRIT